MLTMPSGTLISLLNTSNKNTLQLPKKNIRIACCLVALRSVANISCMMLRVGTVLVVYRDKQQNISNAAEK